MSSLWSSNQVQQIREKYKDKLQLVYRHFRYHNMNMKKQLLSAEAAGKQGKFWEMHDKLFETEIYLMKPSMDCKGRLQR
jgi:protein-disulfide isomerase